MEPSLLPAILGFFTYTVGKVLWSISPGLKMDEHGQSIEDETFINQIGLGSFVLYLHHMGFLDPPWGWQFFITLGVEYTVLEFLGPCSNVEICLPTKWPDEGSMVDTGVFLMNRPEQ